MRNFLYILLITTSIGQTISDYAFTGAKTTAQAGAVVSEKGGIENIFHNPAGIVELDNAEFSMGGGNLYGYNWLPSYYAIGVMPIPDLGNVGFSLQQFETKYSNITLSKEQVFSIAQGFNIQKDKNSHMALGYTANIIQWKLGNSAGISGDGVDGQNLTSTNANVMTIDVGILASLREKYRFGILIKNVNSGTIGKNMSRQILPQRIHVGITYKPIPGLSTTISAERVLANNTLQIKGSIRYKVNSLLQIYSGAQLKPNRFGFGCELMINQYIVTYSLLTHPVLPSTQQIAIGFKL
tara:strand:+ start:905 stop:1792 length:888 start_codon:yes stop_codon:yes gene_type:complete